MKKEFIDKYVRDLCSVKFRSKSETRRLLEEYEAKRYQKFLVSIGMLRQWLNEDRITDLKKMVSSEDLESWFK